MKNLKKILKERKITQKQLAQFFKITEPTLSRYINNIRPMPLSVAKKIAEYLNVSIDYLIQ